MSVLAAVMMVSGVAQASDQVSAIVGGVNVSASQAIAKRTVALFMWQNSGSVGLCTGSIMDDSHILTAAHCVSDFKQGVVVFSTNSIIDLVKKAAQQGIKAVPQIRVMTSAVAQPGYSGQEGGDSEFNDLAIITFQGGLAPGYEPAHFLPKAQVLGAFASKTTITLSGYGITAPHSNDPNAGDQGAGTLRQVQVAFQSLSPNQIDVIVAGQMGHDACSGDSGGPAMIQAKGDVYVIGVASRSDCRVSSIYTLIVKENLPSVSNVRVATR